jgi:hypothetical protein
VQPRDGVVGQTEDASEISSYVPEPRRPSGYSRGNAPKAAAGGRRIAWLPGWRTSLRAGWRRTGPGPPPRLRKRAIGRPADAVRSSAPPGPGGSSATTSTRGNSRSRCTKRRPSSRERDAQFRLQGGDDCAVEGRDRPDHCRAVIATIMTRRLSAVGSRAQRQTAHSVGGPIAPGGRHWRRPSAGSRPQIVQGRLGFPARRRSSAVVPPPAAQGGVGAGQQVPGGQHVIDRPFRRLRGAGHEGSRVRR